SDCRSARKRAFAATVTQPLLASGRSRGRLLRPSQSMAATARRAAERALNATPAPAAAPVAAPSRRMDIIFLVATLVGVLSKGASIPRQTQKSRQSDAPQIADQPAAVAPGSMSNTV